MKSTLVTDIVQEMRAKYPELRLPAKPTSDDMGKYSKAKRAYARELRARVRMRFGLEPNATSE